MSYDELLIALDNITIIDKVATARNRKNDNECSDGIWNGGER